MIKYYYSDGKGKFGPLSLEELFNKDLQPDSLIWHKGLDKWRLAKNIEALSTKFEDQHEREAESQQNSQKTVSENQYGNNKPGAKNENDVKIQKKLSHVKILCLFGLFIFLFVLISYYNTAFEYYYTVVSDVYNKQGLINDYNSFKKYRISFIFIATIFSIVIILSLYYFYKKKIKN
ncbi:MAG: DUF4339 domain-containing protein [Mesonia sp.]|uniref:DUF4339 domain-containing protein n=1 Tax=Mesonia sp. TaxID=1960830 RepID=UPI003F9BE74C